MFISRGWKTPLKSKVILYLCFMFAKLFYKASINMKWNSITLILIVNDQINVSTTFVPKNKIFPGNHLSVWRERLKEMEVDVILSTALVSKSGKGRWWWEIVR